MSRVYDNWERLVEATLTRELLRELALCPSLRSSSSIDLSSRFDSLDFDDSRKNSIRSEHVDLDTSSSQQVFGSSSSSSTGAIAGWFARLLAAPAIALAHYRIRKPHAHFFDDPEADLRQFKGFSLPELQVATETHNVDPRNRSNSLLKYRANAAKVRLVRCPRCRKILPELPELHFYKCGGCGAILKGNPAKSKGVLEDGLSEISNDSKGIGIPEESSVVNASEVVMEGANGTENGKVTKIHNESVTSSTSQAESRELLTDNEEKNGTKKTYKLTSSLLPIFLLLLIIISSSCGAVLILLLS